MRFQFIKNHSKEFCIGKMAKILGVSRCGYYEFSNRNPSKRAKESQALIKQIKAIHKSSRGVYGSPRVHAEIKRQGGLVQEKE